MRIADIARGDLPAELVIKNARVANIFTQEYELADVAVYSGKIAGIGKYDGEVIHDAGGRVLIPGMIDGHVHIEDTMMTPPAFAEIAALHGTSAVMADPHEISNALGMSGLEYMFRASQGLPIDVFYGAPSCVPASDFESAYEELDMSAMQEMFRKKYTQHLGEMMNFPAVINGDAGAWGKILAAGDVPLTGHAPNVTGHSLNAYLTSGINSDHECNDLDEAREKLKRGMWIMIREGASFPNLRTLLPLIRENVLNASRCMIVSDDITARYLLEQGHMDVKMRIMLSEGINPFVALRMVTLSPAEYFRLHDRGIIAPSKLADFAILDSDVIDENFTVREVFKSGRQIVRDNEVITPYEQEHIAPVIRTKVTRIPSVDDIRVKAEGRVINAIGVTAGTVLTRTLELEAKIEDDYAVSDSENDIAKIVVLERHRNSGRFAVGFVHGLGITRGAVGSSVAHDAHNFVVAGHDDESIITALHELADMGGGLVVSDGKSITSKFALPIGGLMSYLKPEEVSRELSLMEDAAVRTGIKIPHPFMVLSFLCLSVIPELRITDKGYVDITHGGKQNIFVR
ncbi:MAG: adenine deaminase [Synergistaceae bacterium]|nr:adenine deaminase [Synergistaceae bacterium]